MLRSAKDGLKIKIQGIYRIQYEGEKVYVGQSRKTVEKRCKEYQRYISLHQTEKSAVVKHCNSTVYCMNISSTSILHWTSGYLDRLAKETNEIRLNNNTGWRTKCHTIDCARNTFLLLQKHLTSGTELILMGWKIIPNEKHVQYDHRFASQHLANEPLHSSQLFDTCLQKARGTTSLL